MARTIFDRYGGFRKISKIVISLYDKVTESPITEKYFVNTNMKRLIDHQTQFVASLMGGPVTFTDEHLERVHSHLNINEEGFYEIVELLRETLEDFDFKEPDIDEVEHQFLAKKNHIVQKY